MNSVHGEVLALLRQWRDELDAGGLTMSIDLPALRARKHYQALQFPSIAREIDQVRATVLRSPLLLPIDEVVEAVPVEIFPATAPGPPYAQAWIPDELYPSSATGAAPAEVSV